MIASTLLALNIGGAAAFVPPAASAFASRPMAIASRPLFMMAERSSWPALDDGRSEADLFEEADTVFGMLDLNSDGDLAKEELQQKMITYDTALVDKVFASIDTDSSGGISKDEFRKAYVKHPTLRTAPGLGGELKRE